MSTVQTPATDELLQAKNRVLQRAMAAEIRKDRATTVRNYLAAAHLELILSDDYLAAGREDLAIRSRKGAASCFWLGGRIADARKLFEALCQDYPQRRGEFQDLVAELEQDHPEIAKG